MMSDYVKKVFGDTDRDNKPKKKKKKKYNSCDDDSRFVGLYRGSIYAISTEYDLVYDYMTCHRRLSNGEFSIEIREADNIQVMANMQCELVEYHGLYVADRDVIMSNLFMKDVKTEIRDIEISLIGLAKLVGQLGEKDSHDEVKQFLKTFKYLEGLRVDSERMEELEKIAELDNKFIYSDMSTYNHLLSQYEFYFNAFGTSRFL